MQTKLDKARQALDAATKNLADMRTQAHSLQIDAVGLEARTAEPAAIAQATATRQALEALRADIATAETVTVPAARARVDAVKRERETLARDIANMEKRIEPYVPNLANMEDAAGLLLTLLRVQARQEEKSQQQDALNLLLWVRDMRRDLAALPNWRKRLADYGE